MIKRQHTVSPRDEQHQYTMFEQRKSLMPPGTQAPASQITSLNTSVCRQQQ
jgi:hypothetical protein